ncbi:MAG: HEAT repeat domain-containing protein [Planctomycetota bacterium]
MANKRLPLLVGLLVVLLAAALVWRWQRGQTPKMESPAELARQALNADSPEKQRQVAVKLQMRAASLPYTGTRNEAQPYLKSVFEESKNPEVRIACMHGFATLWDYECVPTMLDLMDDPSLPVSSMAANTLLKLMGVLPSFNPNAPPEKRKAATVRIREMWKIFSASKLKVWQKRLAEKDAKF